MFNHSWKKELLTLPNLLSILRLLLIPVYIRMYRNAVSPLDHYLAGSVLAVSCLTDLADGWIAREFHLVTTAGKLLDPLADKLTQLALIVTLCASHRVLLPVLMLFLFKETFQLLALLIFAGKGKALPGALISGKLCTAALFGSMFLLVLFPTISERTVRLLAAADGIFLLLALFSYAGAYFGKRSRLTDLQ